MLFKVTVVVEGLLPEEDEEDPPHPAKHVISVRIKNEQK
jgi:hypothetical protein